MGTPYHITVLLHESIRNLVTDTDGIYVDATLGGGGHTRLLLESLSPKARVFAFDQDEAAGANLPDDPRVTWIQANFRHLKKFLRVKGVTGVQGILADLGVSSHQLDTGERGFSYRFDAPLDMRMDRGSSLTAAEVLNTYSEATLQKLFQEYGEVRNAKTLAAAIVRQRDQQPFSRIAELNSVAEQVMIGEKWKYLSQLYQALRIEVNDEIGALQDFLLQSAELLNPGGRLAVISFHSLEDRPVKNFLRQGTFTDEATTDLFGNRQVPFRLITRKPILPTEEELKQNPRSRSAKLRVAEKK